MLFFLLLTVSLLLASPPSVDAKIYKKCEVVRKLEENGIPRLFIPTYACLSEHESNYNSSSKIGPTPTDVTSYGIFQVIVRLLYFKRSITKVMSPRVALPYAANELSDPLSSS